METVLNRAQVELLNAMSVLKTDDEIMQLKQAISDFFARRADEEMDKLWATGQWDETKLQSFTNSHFRTAYK
ncbi:MAG: dephospho-CoA kinase [Bacteroidaceae bacterium]|nr:dephospho-CoA kinase [Bacteroidaceae bacterium]